ncbi:TIGR01621 family pseudouridine synthase [Salinimonas chungwhensis]|uniref:TIGR01621 family pseudouridine synthase n=1 Tax=Salinimonas chungwhensis TaxID=265425 RepID=UPI00037C0FC5|nr:TIGR01621 family pseudouridine synthase [Salinimonas chungwhensis]
MTEIPILFTHNDFYVVAKPAGVTMHDAELGIITLLRRQLGEQQLFLCHRLDDGTSGCLLIARNAVAAATLSELFAQHHIQKFYIALGAGKPRQKQGTIIGDMKNRRRGQHILLKTRENPAITQFFSQSILPGIRGFILRPLTGKTHQIRVALKSLGSPVLGDTLYGKEHSDRLYLHAWRLCFDYQKQSIAVTCPFYTGVHFFSRECQMWLTKNSQPEQIHWPTGKLPKSMLQEL